MAQVTKMFVEHIGRWLDEEMKKNAALVNRNMDKLKIA